MHEFMITYILCVDSLSVSNILSYEEYVNSIHYQAKWHLGITFPSGPTSRCLYSFINISTRAVGLSAPFFFQTNC